MSDLTTNECARCGAIVPANCTHQCSTAVTMQSPPPLMVYTPTAVSTPEHLSRRDLLALERFDSMDASNYNSTSDMAEDAYAQADALIKASGEGSDD